MSSPPRTATARSPQRSPSGVTPTSKKTRRARSQLNYVALNGGLSDSGDGLCSDDEYGELSPGTVAHFNMASPGAGPPSDGGVLDLVEGPQEAKGHKTKKSRAAKTKTTKVTKKKEKKKEAATSEPVGPAGAADPSSDDTPLLTTFMQLRNSGLCSCAVLSKAQVAPLRVICKARAIPTKWRGENGMLSSRDKPKKQLLLAMCRVCSTIAEVETALAGGALREGIPVKYWTPAIQQDNLSVLDAFHLSIQRENPPDTPFTAELDAFRAHFLRNVVSNFKFYIIKGKINRTDDMGQDGVPLYAERVSNFVRSLDAAFQHYNGVHSVRTCGRLRKGLVCTPFKLLSACDPTVERVLKSKVRLLCAFVVTLADPLRSITNPFHPQDLLRRSFQLDP